MKAKYNKIEYKGVTCFVHEDDMALFESDCEDAGDDSIRIAWIHRQHAHCKLIGDFIYNANDICLNENVSFYYRVGKKHWSVEIRTAMVSVNPERWATSWSLNTGTGGTAYGIGLWDDCFATEAEAAKHQLMEALKYFQGYYSNADGKKIIKAIEQELEKYPIEPVMITTTDKKGQAILEL